MSYTILYCPGVARDMARLPKAVLRRMDKAIMSLADDPRPPGCRKAS